LLHSEATPAQVGKEADRLAIRLFHHPRKRKNMTVSDSRHSFDRSAPEASIVGDVDLSNAAKIGSTVIGAVVPGVDLVVDCGAMTFLESRGIAMMVQVHETAQRLGSRVIWVDLPPEQRRLLEITALEDVLLLGTSTPGAASSPNMAGAGGG
jgi:anti-anti-sigma factor